MRILITGSSGQLGTEIARQLSQDYEITGVDVIPGEWTQHRINITDRDAVDTIKQSPGSHTILYSTWMESAHKH